ncbi:hypothetical protein MSG28_008466 [Choristoneura fumiferana]|nr:hypothetical protein MSG28_008466 [Choristoneura fumiferana]
MAQDKLIWKIVLDFAILLCVGAPLLAFVIWGEAPKVGFFEDDRSLRLPYKEETISETWLAAVVIIEFVRDRKGRSVGEKFLCGSLIPGWLWESYITIGVFTFGAACQQLTAEGYIQEYTCSNTEISENRISQMRLSFPSAHASFAMYVAVFWIIPFILKPKRYVPSAWQDSAPQENMLPRPVLAR